MNLSKKLAAAALAASILFSCNPQPSQETVDDSGKSTGDAVDLGLSVNWRNRNVGASVPEEFGGYYSWGEVETKSFYDWSTYKWGTDRIIWKKYNTLEGHGLVDRKLVLDPEDDVAYVTLGKGWRMPTDAELTELIEKCIWEWVTLNDVPGYRVTGKSTGNSIFLPASGSWYLDIVRSAGGQALYWSSSLDEEDPTNAWRLYFNADVHERGVYFRHRGFTVRPVIDK